MTEKERGFAPGSCFGYHTDLHLWDNDTDAGSRALPDELEETLRIVNPDWVQVDSKGHPGFCSFFSKIPAATPAPHLKYDAIAAWREATRRLGLKLICHYSGFLDNSAVAKHPEWKAQTIEDPAHVWGSVCPRSGYWEELMIPQLLELVNDYGVDGFWIDGDLWGFPGCRCEKCTAEFIRRTGIAEIPEKPGDPHWRSWWDFQYQSCQEVIRHYTEVLHRNNPDTLLCSNWLDSVIYPDWEKINTDWLSGDTVPLWSLDQTRTEVRWMNNRKKSWDLMNWPHLGFPDFQLKSLDMLCQEAAQTIAGGGRCSFFEQASGIRTSRQIPWRMRRFRALGEFIRSRAPFSLGTESIPEIAVLHSREIPRLECCKTDPAILRQCVSLLLENHYHVDILEEETLRERIAEFPVTVIPEGAALTPDTAEWLRQYVQQGGKLLIAGAGHIRTLGEDFCGIAAMEEEIHSPMSGRRWNLLECKDDMPLYFLSDGQDGVIPLKSPSWCLARQLSGGIPLEPLYTSYDPEESRTALPAAWITHRGKGAVAVLPCDFFTSCRLNSFLPEIRRFLDRVMRRLYPARPVEICAPSVIDVQMRRRDGVWFLHLLNRSSGVATSPERVMIDEIPPVGPVKILIRGEHPRLTAHWLPEGTPLAVTHTAEGAEITVPSVRIHGAVQVQF